MNRQHTDRQLAEYHQDPRFRRLLLASLGAHLAVALLFSGVLLPRFQRDLRPVYHVDLVNLPVMSPQAGRPDARPEPVKAPPKPAAPEPVKAAPPAAPPKPAPKPEAVKLAKPEPAKPAAVKPKKPEAAPKPAPKEPVYEKETLSAIDDLRRRQEIERLKQDIAQLGAAKDTRQAAVPNAPVGMQDGKGTEVGISYDAWLHEYLKQAWTLSQYQVSRRDLQATVKLFFDAQGNLQNYDFVKKSGEERFDDSVRKAVLQLKKLPNPPGSRMEKEVRFNLKDLLE
jgi:outer membrane biosynthesis protein TonB